MSADDMQLGQTEVCTDSKSTVGLNNLRHNHTHSATHNHGHNHLHGVLIGTMQSYGNNLIESFKTEPMCQVQCMDCQKVRNIDTRKSPILQNVLTQTYGFFHRIFSNSISTTRSNWRPTEWFIMLKQTIRFPLRPPELPKKSTNAVYAWRHSASIAVGGNTKSAIPVNEHTNAISAKSHSHNRPICIG